MGKKKAELKVFKTNESATLPQYATESSACFDICACIAPGSTIKIYNQKNDSWEVVVTNPDEVLQLLPDTRILVPTGLIFDIPSGYSLRLHPRSGLALKSGITLLNCEGVVDEDYVEETRVILFNHSRLNIPIKNGDRICQGELTLDSRCDIKEISERPATKTSRNGGFGSTGK